MTNTKLLNQKIAESGLKKQHIASRIGITTQALTYKIENVRDFKASEITTLSKLLGVSTPEEREALFFAQDVN
jgi:hypothetical protein